MPCGLCRSGFTGRRGLRSKTSLTALTQNPQVPPIKPSLHALEQFFGIAGLPKFFLKSRDVHLVALQHSSCVLRIRLRANMERVPGDDNFRLHGRDVGQKLDPVGPSLGIVRLDQPLMAVPQGCLSVPRHPLIPFRLLLPSLPPRHRVAYDHGQVRSRAR